MKKLIMLSAACLIALGTFAGTGKVVKQDGSKAKPATENKADGKKDAKGTKHAKDTTKKADAKKPATEKK